jgi:hypothetical protein
MFRQARSTGTGIASTGLKSAGGVPFRESMRVLRVISFVVFGSMVVGVCAAALTACGGDDTVVQEAPADGGTPTEASAK